MKKVALLLFLEFIQTPANYIFFCQKKTLKEDYVNMYYISKVLDEIENNLIQK